MTQLSLLNPTDFTRMTRLARAACWATERRWLKHAPVWLLYLYAVQIARLAGVPWQHEEWTRRLLAARTRAA